MDHLILSTALAALSACPIDEEPSRNGERIGQYGRSWAKPSTMLMDLEEAGLDEIFRARVTVQLAADIPQEPLVQEIDHLGEGFPVPLPGVTIHGGVGLGRIKLEH